jgi:small-conductance mechanosensitive channel
MSSKIFDFLNEITGISQETQKNIFITILVILILWLLRLIILKVVWRRTQDVKTRYNWKSALSYIVPLLGFLIILSVWLRTVGNLGAFLGIFSAGLAIALKDPVTNIAGWAFIVARKPFKVGDRIQIGEYSGDVIDIRLFQFTLLEIGNWVDADQSTGRIIHIPNEKIFIEAQANFSTGFEYIWNEIPVLLTFESDWKKGKSILQRIVNEQAEHLSEHVKERIMEASKKFMIFYTHLTPIVYTSVKDSGVLLTIRYLTNPRKRRGTEMAIWENILKEFAQYPEIDFAYPTRRFYNHAVESTNQPNIKTKKE